MKIAIVGAGAMGSVYAGLFGSAGHEVWAIDPLGGARRGDPAARPARRGGERRPRRRGSDATTDAGRGRRGRPGRDRHEGDGRRGGGRGARDPRSGRRRSCSRSRTASAARTPPPRARRRPGRGRRRRRLRRLDRRAGPRPPPRAGADPAGRAHGPGDAADRGARRGLARAPGSRSQTFDDVQRLVWEKLDLQRRLQRPVHDPRAGRSARCSTIRDAWSVAAGCAAEAYAVGRAAGVELDFDDPVAYVRAFGEKIPGARPSMLLDHLAGRRTRDRLHQRRDPARRPRGRASPHPRTRRSRRSSRRSSGGRFSP